MSKKVDTVMCYTEDLREYEKINCKFQDIYNTGIKPVIQNFEVETSLKPGFVNFNVSFDNNPDYESFFILTANDALRLGNALVSCATDASNREILDHESYIASGKLYYMVMKGLIDTIRVTKSHHFVKDYEPPFYAYTFKAYSKNECLYSYKAIMNLQFDSINAFEYWRKSLTDNDRVKIYFDNYDPVKETKEREEKLKKEKLEQLDKFYSENPTLAQQIIEMYKKPKPIKK